MADDIKGRADTYEKKEQALKILLGAWERAPRQRLGQLIVNVMRSDVAIGRSRDELVSKLFFIEDEKLVEKIYDAVRFGALE